MTNKEYITSQLGFAPSNDFLIEGALLDAGLSSSSNYVPGNPIPFKTALLQVLRVLISTADIKQGSDETGNEVKYDRPSILKRIQGLETELAEEEDTSGPTINGRNPW